MLNLGDMDLSRVDNGKLYVVLRNAFTQAQPQESEGDTHVEKMQMSLDEHSFSSVASMGEHFNDRSYFAKGAGVHVYEVDDYHSATKLVGKINEYLVSKPYERPLLQTSVLSAQQFREEHQEMMENAQGLLRAAAPDITYVREMDIAS